MLYFENNEIRESVSSNSLSSGLQSIGSLTTTGCAEWKYIPSTNTYWNSYPIYVTTDRTEKAINVLKKLEEEKVIEVKSVKRFIELVEKIKQLI